MPRCGPASSRASLSVALIQEPVASAVAAGWRADAEGYWLVYDLGGGTLDVSLLETRDGWLRVVDHGGDNFRGQGLRQSADGLGERPPGGGDGPAAAEPFRSVPPPAAGEAQGRL